MEISDLFFHLTPLKRRVCFLLNFSGFGISHRTFFHSFLSLDFSTSILPGTQSWFSFQSFFNHTRRTAHPTNREYLLFPLIQHVTFCPELAKRLTFPDPKGNLPTSGGVHHFSPRSLSPCLGRKPTHEPTFLLVVPMIFL